MSRLPLVRRALRSGVMTRDALALFRDAGWDESKHQRGAGGRFGSAVESDANAKHHAARAEHHFAQSFKHASSGNEAAARAHDEAGELHSRAKKTFSASTRAFVRGDHAKGQEYAETDIKHSKAATAASRRTQKLD